MAKYNIPFCLPTLGQEEKDAVCRVIDSGWLAAGKETEAFEKEFCKYIGAKYCIFTNSGTAALKMAYKWADKIYGIAYLYYPDNTFCATYSAGIEVGGNDFMYPYSSHTGYSIGNMPHGNSRVNVHYGGVKDTAPCLIEDSAHRIEPNDKLVGKIRIYSFYVTKNLTTGQGGMFCTDERSIYEKARLYWKDGIDKSTADRHKKGVWDYKVITMAGGYDGCDIAAAIGRVQLSRLPDFTTRRNKIRDKFNKAFKQSWQGNHLYPYFVKSEKELGRFIDYMSKNGIQCGYHYPNTGWLGVSLPIYPLLKDKEVEYIIKKVKQWQDTLLK